MNFDPLHILPVSDVPHAADAGGGDGIALLPPPSLLDECKELEAFATPAWAVEAVLDVEILPQRVIDPCVGLGALAGPLLARGHRVHSVDVRDWRETYAQHVNEDWRIMSCDDEFQVANFLTEFSRDLTDAAVFMNPPFSKASEFVDRARELGARKIVCFQRQAWRESDGRDAWWQDNRPARVWLCGARAACWRFDLLDCAYVGEGSCPNEKKRGTKRVDKTIGCAKCLGSSPTAHAFYVWERGHTGAELTNTIFPKQQEAAHG